jgi:hypothetical protein
VPGQEQGLGGSDGLTEPQQVDQQLGQVPGAMAADVRDALRSASTSGNGR